MHKNSLEIYNALRESGELTKRQREVLTIFFNRSTPLRDWDVLQIFKKGSDNMNLVRPRITELHHYNYLIEGPVQRGHSNNCNVRTSVINVDDRKQLEMF